jgi:hypothetical protein
LAISLPYIDTDVDEKSNGEQKDPCPVKLLLKRWVLGGAGAELVGRSVAAGQEPVDAVQDEVGQNVPDVEEQAPEVVLEGQGILDVKDEDVLDNVDEVEETCFMQNNHNQNHKNILFLKLPPHTYIGGIRSHDPLL